MRQKQPSFYDVQVGERVEINVTPVEVGGTVRAAQNGLVLDNIGSNAAPQFEFVASAAVRWHFVQMAFHFPGGASNEAQYKVEFCGSGHECFKDLPVTNSGPSGEPTDRIIHYEFEVLKVTSAAKRTPAGKKKARKKASRGPRAKNARSTKRGRPG